MSAKRFVMIVLAGLVMPLAAGAGRLFSAESAPAAEPSVNVEFILDGSGSMWSRCEDAPKIVMAVNALRSVVPNLPGSVRTGLRTFGLKQAPHPQDTTLLVPMGASNRNEILAALAAVKPAGRCPLLYSIERAIDDLAEIGGAGLVLVMTDGKEDFVESPCRQMRELRPSDSDVKVQILGLCVDDEEVLREHTCLADAGGSQYIQARSETQVAEAMKGIVADAIATEEHRRAMIRKEEERKRLIESNTLITVHFSNVLPDVFAEFVRVIDFEIDGRPVKSGESETDIQPGRTITLHEGPAPPGEHSLRIRYVKIRNGREVVSEISKKRFSVESGRTTRIECRAVARLLSWALDIEVQ